MTQQFWTLDVDDGTEVKRVIDENTSELYLAARLSASEPKRYDFNGVDTSLFIPRYATLGDPAVYRRITYEATNDLGYIIPAEEPFLELCKVGANYHDGTLKNLRILDTSPIQDTDIVYGDNVRHITLNTKISLAANFVIRFNWIRRDFDASGTGTQFIAVSNADSRSAITVSDAINGSDPNRLILEGSSTTTAWPNAFAGLAGKQVAVQITRTGTSIELKLDGVSKGINTATLGTIDIDTFGAIPSRAISTFGALCGLNRVEIFNVATFALYTYLLNEGSGNIVTNTGPTGSGFNGAWSAPAVWTYIPRNSRFYKLDEGELSVILDTDNDVSPKDGQINNHVEANWITPTRRSSIWSKPAGQPIILVETGQSNGLSSGKYTVPITPNPRVFDFGTLDTVSPQDATLQWRVAPTNNRARSADYVGTSPYTGYYKGGFGSTVLACANQIQLLTGRDVYVIQVNRGDTPIADWISTDPAKIGVALNVSVEAALATTELTGLSVDAVLWMQGESNTATASATYATDWQTWRTSTEGEWTTVGVTPFYIFDFTEAWNWVGIPGLSGGVAPTKSVNMEYLAANAVAPISLVSSAALASDPGTPIHFSGDASNAYGLRFADAILYQP